MFVNIQTSYMLCFSIRNVLSDSCVEIPLTLLTEEQSISLLLNSGGVEATDDATEAAARIAKALGYLRKFYAQVAPARLNIDCHCIQPSIYL